MSFSDAMTMNPGGTGKMEQVDAERPTLQAAFPAAPTQPMPSATSRGFSLTFDGLSSPCRAFNRVPQAYAGQDGVSLLN